MSDLEQNLRDMLAQRADATTTAPGDWQDLTIRMARRNRRSRRVMAGALALVLVVGPLAGFAVARAVEDSSPSGQVVAGGTVMAASNQAATARADAFRLAIGSANVGGLKLEKLFRRTAGGVEIRAYLSRYNAGGMCQGDGWCPPSDCFADGAVIGELSTEEAVGNASGGHYAAVVDDLKATGAGVFGANGEGSPVRWVTAQTSDKVAKVRVSFEGGGSDEMAPVDDVVLLAAPADTAKTGGTIEALDSSGSVMTSTDVAAAGVSVLWDQTVFTQTGADGAISVEPTTPAGGGLTIEGTPTTTVVPGGTTKPSGSSSSGSEDPATNGLRAECTPPAPTLPAPGEQPADAAAARAAVVQAYATAYSGIGDPNGKRDAVEDSDELADVIAQADSGSFAQQVKDASAVVTDVVFTSPTEATVRYDINVKDYSNFTGRIGKARLIDGTWKVARVTICADLSLAGATCPTK
jgi:hypothetical protein